jgi:peroxiredoxin
MKKWIILGIYIVALTNVLQAQVPASTIPDFRFLQKSGAAFTRQQLPTGKPLFFAFFDITCDHCQKAMQYLNSHYRELGKAAIYLVTLDPGPSAEAFLGKHAPQLFRLPNTVLLRDTRNQFITLFQPRKYPSLFLYSPKQQLILYSDEEKDLAAFVTKIKTAK